MTVTKVRIHERQLLDEDARHEDRNAECLDCGRNVTPFLAGRPNFELWDFYLVRGEVWSEAGMDGWRGGHLCRKCIETRLGRELRIGEDLLGWIVPGTRTLKRTQEYEEVARRSLDALNELVGA